MLESLSWFPLSVQSEIQARILLIYDHPLDFVLILSFIISFHDKYTELMCMKNTRCSVFLQVDMLKLFECSHFRAHLRR
jgi:hypothetical protein